jgi:LysR family transcriptional regulator, regulator for bpeEF and oprC
MRLVDRMAGIEEFIAVAEAGSFVAAAEQLGLTPSGVGKAVQRLEDRIGARLFARTTRRVSLTEDGARLLTRCRRLISDLGDAEADIDVQRTEISGAIRIATPVAYGRLRIVPVLAAFQIAHPSVRIDHRASDKVIDPLEERIDLVVRIGALEDSTMWSRRIDAIRFGVFAAPAYLDGTTPIRTVSDLTNHYRIGFVQNNGRVLDFKLAHEESVTVVNASGGYVTTDLECAIAAAEAALGIVYLPTFIADPSVKRGRLKPVLPTSQIEGPPVNLLYPQPHHMPARIRALADAVIATLRKPATEPQPDH